MSEELEGGAVDAPVTDDGPYGGLVGADGAFTEDWADKLPDDGPGKHRAFLQRYNSLPDVLQGLAEKESFIGKLQGNAQDVTRIPGEESSEEVWAEFRQKMGIPSAAEDYGFTDLPEGLEEGDWNADYAGKVADVLHKGNVPKGVAAELAQLEAARIQEYRKAEEQAAADGAAELESQLKEEWGNAFEENKKGAAIMAEKLGVDLLNGDPELDLIKVLGHLYGKASKSDSYRERLEVDDLTVVEANPQSQLEAMMQPGNEWYDAMTDQFHPRHKAALAKQAELAKRIAAKAT